MPYSRMDFTTQNDWSYSCIKKGTADRRPCNVEYKLTALTRWRRQLRNDPIDERLRGASLDVNLAGSGQLDHQAFAAEQSGLDTAHGFGLHTHRAIERHKVRRIDDIFLARAKSLLKDRAVR